MRREAIGDGGYIAQIDGGSIDALNRQIAQPFNLPRAAVQTDIVFRRADLGGARGQHQALQVHRGQQVLRRQAFRLQQAGVHIDHHLPLLAAVRIRHDGSGNRDQLRTQKVETQIVELVFRKSLTGEAQLQNGNAGCAEVDDLRRLGSGRKLPQEKLRSRGHLGVRGVQTGIRLQEQFDDNHAVIRGGFQMFDVVYQRGERFLVRGGQAAFEFFRVQTRIGPGHGDHGDVDIREDVGGCPENDHRSDDQNQKRQDQERVRL